MQKCGLLYLLPIIFHPTFVPPKHFTLPAIALLPAGGDGGWARFSPDFDQYELCDMLSTLHVKYF